LKAEHLSPFVEIWNSVGVTWSHLQDYSLTHWYYNKSTLTSKNPIFWAIPYFGVKNTPISGLNP